MASGAAFLLSFFLVLFHYKIRREKKRELSWRLIEPTHAKAYCWIPNWVGLGLLLLFLAQNKKEKTKKTTPHQRVGWDAQAKVHLSEIAANETQFWFFFGGVFAGFFFSGYFVERKEKPNKTKQRKQTKRVCF
jgi:hypothetical protein